MVNGITGVTGGLGLLVVNYLLLLRTESSTVAALERRESKAASRIFYPRGFINRRRFAGDFSRRPGSPTGQETAPPGTGPGPDSL